MVRVSERGERGLEIELRGKLDAGAMKAVLDEFESKAAHIEQGTLLYDVVEFHLPSLGALAIEFSRLPALLALARKFRRAAVLTDQGWLARVSEFEGALLPGLEIKGFERDQRAEAEAWLAEAPAR